jgi:hypothetical protein
MSLLWKRTIKHAEELLPAGLGLTSTGHLIAAWTTAKKDKLIIEFLPNDQVRFVLSLVHADDTERFAGKTTVSLLRNRLNQFVPSRWFDVQEAKD